MNGHITRLIKRYPVLSPCANDIGGAYEALKDTFSAGGTLLVAGNGGSSADAGHIVGELMKEFARKRPPRPEFIDTLKKNINKTGLPGQNDLPYIEYLSVSLQRGLRAIDLGAHKPLITACINDIGGDSIYAQQLFNYGGAGDAFMGISTSGNAKNLVYALVTAKAKGIKTISLLGGKGGVMKNYSDIAIIVPETETYKVQELHLPVYHTLCLMLEEYFFT
jgi:D-sedoheptulose 7-phosphate isomerase